MKKILLVIFTLFSLSVFAQKDLEKDITMESYEQSWIDSKGTLALKNNTNEEIKNVVFLITYLDMSGKELDYEEFAKSISIAPGMTKKLDVPAYEHGRNYHYYKSENMPGGSPSFKIKFQLKDYNVEDAASEEIDAVDDLESDNDFDDINGNKYGGLFIVLMILIILFVIGITVGLYILVAVMAKNRHRSVVAWLLLSFFASPLLIIIILLVIGNNDDDIINNYDRE